MDSGADRIPGNPVLRYFGLENRDKARAAFLWAMPYLSFMAVVLVGFSLLVQWLWPVPVWVHGVAIVLALVHLFLFLARIRKSAIEGPDPGAPDAG